MKQAPALELRSPRRDEVPAIVELLNAHSRQVDGIDSATPEFIDTWFDSPGIDVARDIRVAVDRDGGLLGYVDVGDQADEHLRFWIDLRPHPVDADRAVARRLVGAMEERACELAAPGAVVRGIVSSEDGPTRALYESLGYRYVRSSYRMRIELDRAPEPPRWPDGIGVRTMQAGEERAVYEVEAESFADHWEWLQDPYEEWQHWNLGRGFDPDLWFLALSGSDIVGICLCREREWTNPELGWIATLGVTPPWRRRGIASALLRHSFGVLYGRGVDKVGLGVDAENVTGAVALYERAGMHVAFRSDTLDKPLD